MEHVKQTVLHVPCIIILSFLLITILLKRIKSRNLTVLTENDTNL